MSGQTEPEKAQVKASTASTYSDEKGRASQVEAAPSAQPEVKLEHPLYNPDVDVSGVDERKLIRKLDFYLVPWLSFLYLLSFLDRTSIGNAKVRRA